MILTNYISSFLLTAVVGNIFADDDQSINSVFITQPVNVTLHLNDSYQVLALINEGSGTICGNFNLLVSNENGTFARQDIRYMFNKHTPFDGSQWSQGLLFTVTFNESVKTELVQKSNNNSDNVLIEVHFFHLSTGNSSSEKAYIKVVLKHKEEASTCSNLNDKNVTTNETKDNYDVDERRSDLDSTTNKCMVIHGVFNIGLVMLLSLSIIYILSHLFIS